MTCLLVNGSFVLAMLAGIPGAIFNLAAQRNRASTAPPYSYWRSGRDLFKPELFTELGNRYRRIGLGLTWTAAVFIVICATLIFTLRGDRPGICWFQS